MWRVAAAAGALLIGLPAGFAQAPGDAGAGTPDTQQAAPLLSPDQLDNLVAPIALYPDPLLGQVLAASTYPLEIIEAQQWLAQNGNLQGTQLMDAARRQNWDPSVQALVAFPDALRLLANDIRWTTDLGNAFLAQQAGVMSAVQRMRARARANGRLATTPQQVVRVDTQDSRDVIEILPAAPQVIYVPVYNPLYVWGPPVWGVYPDLWYPAGFGWGFGFGPGIYISAFFPSWGGWGGWGWGCGWFGRSLFVNTVFFNRYGFHGGYYGGGYGRFGAYPGRGGYGGRVGWAHNPGHRMGVPYANRTVASRFGSSRFGGYRMQGNQFAGGARGGSGRTSTPQFNRAGAGASAGGGRSAASGGWRRFGDGNRTPAAGRSEARGFTRSGGTPDYGASGGSRSYRAPAQSNRGYSGATRYQGSASSGRSVSSGYSAPRGSGFSAPRSSSPAYSAPRGGGFSAPRSYSAPSGGFSAPRSFSAPSSSGGRSGSSGGGGGRSGGGGGHRR